MSIATTRKVRGRGWLLAACLIWVGVLLLVPLVGIVRHLAEFPLRP